MNQFIQLTTRVEALEETLGEIQDYIEKVSVNTSDINSMSDRRNPGRNVVFRQKTYHIFQAYTRVGETKANHHLQLKSNIEIHTALSVLLLFMFMSEKKTKSLQH